MNSSENNRNRSELLNPLKVGIFDENDPLRKAVIWGPIGAEAALAQLYPLNISLFYADMNVIEARQETEVFQQALETEGVEVELARDVLAKSYESNGFDATSIFTALLNRAENIYKTYGISRPDIQEEIAALFQADIDRYGESVASQLNYEISLTNELPLGNAIYARDQMNVIGNYRVRSNMAKPIRQPEVALYEKVYKELGYPDPITVPEGQTFEGGDSYIHRGIVYVGVGYRTSRGAAMHIYKELQEHLEQNGLRFAMVEDPHAEKRAENIQMGFMHLDTFSSPVDRDTIAVCQAGAKYRTVNFVETDGNGKVTVRKTNLSFIEHLKEEGNKILSISAEEQQGFGANFLATDSHTILVPTRDNNAIIAQLENEGKRVVHVPMKQITRGFGATHCTTGQTLRQK